MVKPSDKDSDFSDERCEEERSNRFATFCGHPEDVEEWDDVIPCDGLQ